MGKTVMHEEGAGTSVNIRPGVADFTSGFQDVGDHSVASLNEVNKVIILRDVLFSKLKLADEARISLTEDGMSISWDDLTSGKGVLDVFPDVVFSPFGSKLFLNFKEELKTFLVSESMKGTSKSIHTS